MSIFGVGAFYDEDVSEKFIEDSVICVGWGARDAPSLHNLLHSMKAGDVVYIKSFTPKAGLTIKAIGLLRSGGVVKHAALGASRGVLWLWTGNEKVGKLDDKLNVRSNTLYEEFNPVIQDMVVSLIENERK